MKKRKKNSFVWENMTWDDVEIVGKAIQRKNLQEQKKLKKSRKKIQVLQSRIEKKLKALEEMLGLSQSVCRRAGSSRNRECRRRKK